MFVDSHCHLDRLNLEPYNDQLDGAIQMAREAGVSHILCVAVNMKHIDSVIKTTDYSGVFASAGVHPLDLKDVELKESELLNWANHPKVVAIGETGLDYHYDKETQDLQRDSFALQLETAKKAKLPVIVHTREARDDTINLIRSYACTQSAGVMHCFTESWEMAKKALDLNFYISFSGIVTFKNATVLQEIAKKVPSDRILIETDSPYLAPVPYRGKPNEPKYVPEVAKFLAALRNQDLEMFAQITTDNFFTLFNKAAALR